MTTVSERPAKAWIRTPWRAAYAGCLLLLILNLGIAHALRWYNSDDVALQTILGQWQRGYHATAHLGADSFILKVPLYLAVDLVVDNGRAALLLTSLILNVTGFVLFVASVRYFTKKLSLERPHLVIWPLLWVAGLGLMLANALITPNLRNLEIGLAFLLIMLVAKCWDGEVELSPARILVAVPVLGLFLYDDPYFLFVYVVPLIALLLAGFAVRRDDKRPALLAGVLAGGVVAYKVIELVLRAVGLSPLRLDASVADLAAIRQHFRLLVHGGLQLFEADLIDRPLSLAHPRPLLNLVVLLGALLYPLALWRRPAGFREEPWCWFFGVLPLVVAAIFVFSNQASDLASARYLVFVPFVAVVVIGVGLQGIETKSLRNAAVVVVAAATAVNVVTTVDYYREQRGGANQINRVVVAAAIGDGLTKGYAGYWSSNINTYLSRDRVDFIQVECVDARARPYPWLTDDGVLAKRASRTFFLWEADDARSGCTYDDLLRQFGDPGRVVPVTDAKKLLVYDYDLAQRM